MNFENYVKKLKTLYFKERKRQKILGILAIYSRNICQKFRKKLIFQSQLEKYFDNLKSTGKVFAVTEKDEELIQWAE